MLPGSRTSGLTDRVVVGTRRRAELVAAPADGTKRAVEKLLELGELVVDVDVALAAQPVGLGVRRVDESRGFCCGRLHHFVVRYQALLFLDALLHGLLIGDVAVFDQPVAFGFCAADAGLVLALRGCCDANRLLTSLPD